MWVASRTRKPSALPLKLRKPKKKARSLMYMGMDLASGQPSGNWERCTLKIESSCFATCPRVPMNELGFAVMYRAMALTSAASAP